MASERTDPIDTFAEALTKSTNPEDMLIKLLRKLKTWNQGEQGKLRRRLKRLENFGRVVDDLLGSVEPDDGDD